MPRVLAAFPILGMIAVAISRILSRSHALYDLDSVNFALGMSRFDPAVHQPHPPGYFLYVSLARLAGLFIADRNTALVAISVAASCGAAWLIYKLTEDWFGKGPARVSIALFLFSPLGWFHGTVALTYMVEACFSAWIGLLCWRVYSGRLGYALPASAVFAIAAGFRPSIALLLGPLWLFTVWRAGSVRRWAALAVAGVVALCWFIPMVEAAGGFHRYFSALGQLWGTVPGRQTTLSSPWIAVARAVTIAWILILCFGSAVALIFGAGPKAYSRRTRFVYIWLAPGLLFFALVFLLFVNSGYLLVLTPPLFALLAVRGYIFLTARGRRGRRGWRWGAFACAAAINCAVYLESPLYFSHRSVSTLERDLGAITRTVEHEFDPETTLIVGFDSHFLGYRHAGYYLPHFVSALYPELGYPDGKRVFVMSQGDTRLLPRFPMKGLERFVLFPLPEGEQYRSYVNDVLSKLPAGTMRTVVSDGRELRVGPIAALPFLFPATAVYLATPLPKR